MGVAMIAQLRKKERKKDLIIRNIKYVQGLVHNMISADCATDYQSEVQRGRSQRCAGDRLLSNYRRKVNCY